MWDFNLFHLMLQFNKDLFQTNKDLFQINNLNLKSIMSNKFKINNQDQLFSKSTLWEEATLHLEAKSFLNNK